MRPQDVPALRAHLVSMWGRGRPLDEFTRKLSDLKIQGFAAPDQEAANELRALREGEMWWVQRDMLHLMLAATPEVPGDTRLEELPMPAPYGFVVFEEPWLGIDSVVAGKTFEVDAITWSTGQITGVPGMSIMAYQRDRGNFPALRGIGLDWYILGRSDWLAGEKLDELGDHHAKFVPEPSSVIEDRRVIAALWTLAQTPSLVDVERAELPRAARRESERLGLDPGVRVVRLRRQVRDGAPRTSTGTVDWKHRWVVGSHWRRQAYGPGRSLRKLIFVHEFIKGPDDRPLKTPETVKAWVR